MKVKHNEAPPVSARGFVQTRRQRAPPRHSGIKGLMIEERADAGDPGKTCHCDPRRSARLQFDRRIGAIAAAERLCQGDLLTDRLAVEREQRDLLRDHRLTRFERRKPARQPALIVGSALSLANASDSIRCFCNSLSASRACRRLPVCATSRTALRTAWLYCSTNRLLPSRAPLRFALSRPPSKIPIRGLHVAEYGAFDPLFMHCLCDIYRFVLVARMAVYAAIVAFSFAEPE
ncbi:hypothetical protein [Paraburkholderia franconis]